MTWISITDFLQTISLLAICIYCMNNEARWRLWGDKIKQENVILERAKEILESQNDELIELEQRRMNRE